MGWKAYTDDSTISNHRGVIYVEVVDNAGNRTVIGTRLVVVDDKKPEDFRVEAKRSDNSEAYTSGDWVNSNVIFTMFGGDDTIAHLNRYEYRVAQSRGELEAMGWTTVDKDVATVEMAVDAEHTQILYYQFRAVTNSEVASLPSEIWEP